MDKDNKIVNRGGGYARYVKSLLIAILAMCVIAGALVGVVYFRPIDSKVTDLNVCFYGDSITELGHWEKVLNFRVGFNEMYLCGIGSTSFTSSDLQIFLDDEGNYCGRSNVDDVQPDNTEAVDGALSSMDRIQLTIPKDTDLIFVMAGTNDWDLDVDESEFKEAVSDTVGGIRDWLGNDIDIVLMSPLAGRESGNGEEAVNEIGLVTSDYAEFVEEVAEEEDVYFINVFNDTIIEQWNRKLFLKDAVHPNYLGELEIERVVAQWIDENY